MEKMTLAVNLDAVKRAYHQDGERALDWQFHHVMNKEARDTFDAFLLNSNHPLAYEAMTQEQRFKRFMRAYCKEVA